MKPRVLIAEDKIEIRALLTKKFKQLGCRVYAVASGNAAFRIIKTHKVDLVISDIRMPNGSGIDLLRKVKRHKKELTVKFPSVIITTAMLDQGFGYLKKVGASNVFFKAF